MGQANQTVTPSSPQEPTPKLARRSFEALASVKFAVAVVVLITIACGVGTLLPQGREVARYVETHPEAATRLELYGLVGLTHVFSSWWFIALLSVLAASVAACSFRRFVAYRNTRGFAQRRALGSIFVHISILLILAGGVVRGLWGEKGYLELREGVIKNSFVDEKGSHALPFGVRLVKFEIETYGQPKPSSQSAAVEKAKTPAASKGQLLVQWPEQQLEMKLPAKVGNAQVLAPKNEPPTPQNSFRVEVLQFVPDFSVDYKTHEVRSRSSEPRNPAILVAIAGPDYQNHRWLFARFPDFQMQTAGGSPAKESPLRVVYLHDMPTRPASKPADPIKSFKSTLALVSGERAAESATVEVNRPFTYAGYTFYQTGYNPRDLSWTSLQVVGDPGVPLVYAGFGLMILGLFTVFYLNPWIEARRRHA